MTTVGPKCRRGGRRQILVIDDDAAIREVVSDILTDDAFAVAAVRNLGEAKALLQGRCFDLILSDAPMSTWSLSGLAQLQALQQSVNGAPIVLLTGFAEASRLDPKAHGLAAVLMKPFDLDSLLGLVRQLLRVP